jgi:hypothetical protein
VARLRLTGPLRASTRAFAGTHRPADRTGRLARDDLTPLDLIRLISRPALSGDEAAILGDLAVPRARWGGRGSPRARRSQAGSLPSASPYWMPASLFTPFLQHQLGVEPRDPLGTPSHRLEAGPCLLRGELAGV